MLTFARGNAKLDNLEAVVGGPVFTFSLLSGHTCPYAKECLSKAIRHNGKTHIEDGKFTKFRCFSASEESIYTNVYNSRMNNLTQLTACNDDVDKLTKLISSSVPAKAKCVRVHVGGDFFNQPYFNAWQNVAREHSGKLFYAYTKSLPFWIAARQQKTLANNFMLTASRGGWKDKLIRQYKLRQAIVIADPKTCQAIIDSGQSDKVIGGRYDGLEIDHDDSHAALPELKNQSFALLIHGVQPAGSESSKAKRILNGVGSYKGTK